MEPKRPMLASDPPAPDDMPFPLLASPKLDGIRATDWGGTLFTRTLKRIPNVHIQSLAQRARLPACFDGELIVGDEFGPGVFNRTNSAVMSVHTVPEFTWWVFDYVPIATADDLPFEGRYRKLADKTQRLQELHPWIRVLPHTQVNNYAELMAAEQRAVDAQFEGLMGRRLDGPYKHGRATELEGYLFKIKRFVDDEALVIGYEEEMENTNPPVRNALGQMKRPTHFAGMVGKGRLGALICRTRDGIIFNIGAGFTAEERKQLWCIRGTLGGRLAKYKHYPSGAKDKPRHPVFLGWRDPREINWSLR